MQLVIITGMSGAGKTQAVRCLEDLGFFCVDNLPPTLVPRFAELFGARDGDIDKVALVMDIRGGRFFKGLFEALSYLDAQGFRYEILYLEASDESLVRRFKETRRKHPLSPQGRILDGIIEERSHLEEVRGRASKIIDTSELSTQQLREQITELYGDLRDHRLVITLMSFGFKHGIPLDADLVMDVRFLPNPHYVESLKPLTGQEPEVQDYVMNSPVTKTFLTKFLDMLSFLIPFYIQEGKSQLVVAVGCTGGQHRSVTLANKISEMLGQDGQYRVLVQHRDLSRVAGSPG
ncbi:glmZ(sRNA)-inactivating NTPase [Clostridiales bacterium PH28_bin88]|nr:glmZ(sRNA)-inactivating NTPase [Clostridiales bacterium PH28_bin88]